jgi:HAD superfamily hydrolase (TIGR01509 family)
MIGRYTTGAVVLGRRASASFIINISFQSPSFPLVQATKQYYTRMPGLKAATRGHTTMRTQNAQVRGVIFDLDGTLIDIHIPFHIFRERLGIPDEGDILAFINNLPQSKQLEANRFIDEVEFAGIAESKPVSGLVETLAFLEEQGLPFAVVTRGSNQRSRALLDHHGIKPGVLIGRDDAPPKPSPEPIHKAAGLMGLRAEELLLVGDYFYDIEAGNQAGCTTVLLKRPWKKKFENKANYSIHQLSDLIPLLVELG